MPRRALSPSRRLGPPLRAVATLTLLSTAAALSGPLEAQAKGKGSVRGVVRDDAGRELVGARVEALGAGAAVESDGVGAFRLTGLAEAPTRVVVRRLGFAPETALVRVSAERTPPLEVRLRRLAQPLDAVLVRGRRDVVGPLAGFYARMERGMGRYFTQEQIERRNVSRMSDLLRTVPGLRVSPTRYGRQTYRIRGSATGPLVWLDGTPMSAGEVDLDNFDPRTFEGIEIYSSPGTTPPEFAGGRGMSSSGGTIVLWTRRGEAGPPRRKRGAPTPAELVAQLLERGEAFTAAQVDQPVRGDALEPLVPAYPDSLFEARVGGEIEVEFVVNADGRVRGDTYSVIASTHPRLGEVVRRAVVAHAWRPARRGGQTVAQVVQLPFSFVPDSAAARRERQD